MSSESLRPHLKHPWKILHIFTLQGCVSPTFISFWFSYILIKVINIINVSGQHSQFMHCYLISRANIKNIISPWSFKIISPRSFKNIISPKSFKNICPKSFNQLCFQKAWILVHDANIPLATESCCSLWRNKSEQ